MLLSTNSKSNSSTNRLLGLDIYRIVSVFFVFLFHSNIHIGCHYGFLTEFINMSAIFMTAFFILSGYALFFSYQSKSLVSIQDLKVFYLKRLVGILPLYYATSLLYIIFLGAEDLKTNLLLAPIELLGIQSTFSNLFGVTHNGGTWFVSCILICYLIYPFLQEIAKQISNSTKSIIIAICFIILLWSPFIVRYFNTASTYSNPFYRLLEFTIGILLCSMRSDIKDNKLFRWLFSWKAAMIEFFLLILGVTIAVNLNISVGNYMLYNWIALPLFSMLIVSISSVNLVLSDLASNIIKYMCEISYAFFFAQFFTWKTTLFLLSHLGIESNAIKILFSFVICTITSVLLHEIIEKPIAKLLRNKLL